MQRFVEKVLGREVESYFQSTASGYEALEFIDHHRQVRLEVERSIQQALAEWGVVAVGTTLSEFEPEGTTLDEFRRQLANERDQRRLLEHQHRLLELEIRNEQLRADRERIRIGPDLDRAKIELQAKIDQLGTDRAAAALFLDKLAQMRVPNVISSGGGAEELLQHLPLAAALNVINSALTQTDPATPLAATLNVDVTTGAEPPELRVDDAGSVRPEPPVPS